MMSFVPVEENSNQWKAVYVKMSKGEKVNINDKTLSLQPVEGVQPSVLGQDGRLQLPRDAGNVEPPPPDRVNAPEAYSDAVTMKARARSSAPRRRRARKGGRRPTQRRRRSNAPRRKPARRSGGGGRGKGRRRTSLVRKR